MQAAADIYYEDPMNDRDLLSMWVDGRVALMGAAS